MVMTVDDFVDEIAKPIFVLRMARPFVNDNTPMGKSASKRALKARVEIDLLIRKYMGMEDSGDNNGG